MKNPQILKSSNPQIFSGTNKKIIFWLFLLLYSITVAYHAKAQNWISFGNSLTPRSPEVKLVSATNQQVVFTCEVFGFYQTDVIHNTITYQKVTMPGVSNSKQTGYPDLPIVNRAVAYAGKVNPSVSVNVTNQIVVKGNYMIYPAPAYVDSVTSNGFPYLAEVFAINNQAYNQNNQVPVDISAIVSSAQFRDQRFINVVTNPLQWNPTTQKLTANIKCTVTVNLQNNSNEESIENTGIFSPIASELFINYPKNKEPEKPKAISNAKSSYVQYYTLTQPSDANLIVADYLIITDQQFFEPYNPNSELRRIAAHRANYNGYVVAVVSAQNIMSDAVGFPYIRYTYGDDYKFKKERRIREFIKQVYDNGNAPNTYDGHLAYVLLVGDAVDDTSGAIPTVGVPGSRDPYDIRNPGYYYPNTPRPKFGYVTDYYYACITLSPGLIEFDDIGDLYVGRFSVDDTTQLHNMIEKTIHYETDYDFGGWKEKSFFFNSDGLDDTINNPNPPVHHNYLAGNGGYYYSYIPNHIRSPYSYDIKDMYNYTNAEEIPTVMTYFNRGQAYNSYYGHSTNLQFDIGNYNGQYLTTNYLKANLSNTDKFGFMFMNSCYAGMYDLGGGVECIAEELTRYSPNRGFVGIMAASTLAFLDYAAPPNATPKTFQDYLIKENYELLAHILGESILLTKIKIQHFNPACTDGRSIYYNLLGDPALNLRSQGFTVSKNTTLDSIVTVSDVVSVLSGVTLTLPNNCKLFFEKNGRLIIENGAFISFDENASFYGKEMANALEIRGGMITKPNCLPTITFMAPEGKNCGGLVFENPALNASFKKLSLTRAPVFANQLNSLSVESQSTNKSSFIESPLFLKCKNLSISQATFDTCSGISCNLFDESGESVLISNCTFIPPTTQPTNQLGPAIYVSGYKNFNIHDNFITFNSGDGISIYKSGLLGTVKSIKNNVVNFNGTLYYNNNGIKVVQSSVVIENNKITNAKYGISIFDNSVVSLVGNSAATTSDQTQQIFNNTENQLFVADLGSFPSTFRYNYINNQSTNPLVYCAAINIPASSLNVKCNNWGSNFIPTQDLFPYAAYTYTPTWNYDGTCLGDKANTPDTLVNNSVQQLKNVEFKIGIDNHNSPANLALLSEMAGSIISQKEDIPSLRKSLANLCNEHGNDLIGERAAYIENILYVSEGDFNTPVNRYEQRLLNPKSLADSVYAAIGLAHTLLQAGKGSLKDSKIASLYQNQIPKDYDAFYSYKAKLIDLLYPKADKTISLGNVKSNPFTISISPNPASNLLTIEFSQSFSSPVNVKIIEPSGRVMFSEPMFPNADGNRIVLNINEIPVGFYLISIQPDGKQSVTKQIIIER